MSATTASAVSVTKTIPVPPERIFALLTNPAKHPFIDGSGTVRAPHTPGGQRATTRLELGSRFGMDMRMFVPYRMTNTVVEYEENRLIAWRHVGGHRWRWRLAPAEGGGTDVTETFDWSTAPLGAVFSLMGIPERNRKAIRRSLDQLERLVVDDGGDAAT